MNVLDSYSLQFFSALFFISSLVLSSTLKIFEMLLKISSSFPWISPSDITMCQAKTRAFSLSA